jgi:hypothetical protein
METFGFLRKEWLHFKYINKHIFYDKEQNRLLPYELEEDEPSKG